MEKFLNLFLGSFDLTAVLAGFIYLLLGICLSLFVESNNRDINSNKTPFEFSYLYLLRDNFKRILFSILIGAISLRFCSELFGTQPTMYMSFIVGFSTDKFSEYLKKLQK